ncbi:DASS family sodium-coupled anion symporter [Desulfovibrio sp. OttesenSCG-928-I05]|nr:DASS family sodium-coupled anion symporter [Desulfovibrio sp. OttesenSCG-928-I05]
MSKKLWKTLIPLLVFFILLALPVEWFGMPGLTVVEQRVIALFFLAALCWILEPIPIFATSLLVIVLELIMLSDKSFILFKSGAGTEGFGTLLSATGIMATFASPVIMLFLGGFFLAMAATKFRLDINLARVLLRPFGSNPNLVLLGLMVITAVFSMFMSNTATTAMMLAILAPVLACLDKDDPARIGFVLAVPVGANIGGIGTPIGTPPNAIALKYISDLQTISFGEWMLFALPFVLVLLFIAWRLLCFFFPSSQKSVVLDIKGRFMRGWRPVTVYITFGVTILLWVLGGLHGMDSNVVALIPVAVFSCTGIISKEDLKTISWDVLWLVSGGIALGAGLEQTGLAARMVSAIPFASLHPMVVLIFAMLMTLLMANFMSHTATANLVLPLMAAMAGALSGLESLGGAVGLLLAVTFSASLGMSLPISAPPNALASATGMVETGHMARIGVSVGLIGLALTLVMLWVANFVGLL